jgi:hypothetical protein
MYPTGFCRDPDYLGRDPDEFGGVSEGLTGFDKVRRELNCHRR